MKGNRAALTAAVIVGAVLLGWWLFGRGGDVARIDLLSTFDAARKQPDASLFSIADVTLGNETKRSIAIAPSAGSRITWKVRVPDDGWLWVSLGMKPESWTMEGDGVLFLVGISDGRAYDQLFTQHVNPFANSTDRRWIPVKVDLSAYGGEEVDLIFNVRTSPPPDSGDMRNDLAVWGAPEIVVR
jgi:hypothetical protein